MILAWTCAKHHNLQMYLAVESLTAAFFSFIDDIKTSLKYLVVVTVPCRSIYLVAALILPSHTFLTR
jgi:hypothetical protein